MILLNVLCSDQPFVLSEPINTATEYFLGDALGSTRQLTNSTGTVTLAKSYDPYGTVTHASGAAQSAYGFTGEMADVSGLMYLWARYYSPLDGRFMSRDTWEGDSYHPITLNKWSYAHSNPAKFTDPSGHDPWWCQYSSNPEQCEEDYWNIRYSTPDPTPPSTLTEWEIAYGQAIANAAKEIYANRDSYYVWGAIHTDDEWYVNPPPREIPADGFIWNGIVNVKEQTNGRIPIVCADIIAMSYENAGYKLSATFPVWANNSGYTTDPERSVPALYNLLSIQNYWNVPRIDTSPQKFELGDIVINGDMTHSAVIVEVNGARDDASQTFVVQASYRLNPGEITRMSLAEWSMNAGWYGSP